MGYKIFNEGDSKKANFILKKQYSRLSSLGSHELKKLAVVWSYYSAKIEGNSYTYVETESLLIDSITSPKRYEDAKMLKNLYNSFITILEEIKKEGVISIDKKNILRIHSMLMDELIPPSDKGVLREKAVAITGTEYIPPKDRDEIESKFNDLIEKQATFINPIERAIFLHCNIARLQPFIDGNKRISRMLESIILMNNDIIPIYSVKDEDVLNYRKSILHFYETEDYSLYTTYLLNRQIERINEVSLKADVKFDLATNKEIQTRNISLYQKK